ncbi:hypothetical protein B0H15DRAFT_782204 [Mycena belliarum]|uniref:Uncharacterized protein n=1 Tax=Mycena belliarum TaxID=1033014 RepID=A0AAD6U1A9_9AGAR|nr:hypothetical protein B0H15DRAFT_782204 [Mycena belliae]
MAHNESAGKGRDELFIDVFDNCLDQVSEARIKSAVDSLNDTLDNLVMYVVDQGDQLADKHSHLVRSCAHREHSDTILLHSLARQDLTPENRGLLLDVVLHDKLLCELFRVFFAGDVGPLSFDPHGCLQAVIDEMTGREPWAVVQRWRAITATSIYKTHDKPRLPDCRSYADDIIALLAWAHGLSPAEYEPMLDMVQSRVMTLCQEAKELSIQLRRDILSVRMSVISMTAAIFDPELADSVWPEMGATLGDEVVGKYKFGLIKVDESRRVSYLIKPEVATTALIRETSKHVT